MTMSTDAPKTPRWITTEAGQWAWREQLMWRGIANNALSVRERVRLLEEAQQLRERHVGEQQSI